MNTARKELLRQIDEVSSYGRNYYLCKAFIVPAREITLAARKINLHPNHLTIASLTAGFAAACFFFQGGRLDLLAGGMLVYLAYVFDYTDGQLARWTGRVSPLGGWLDQVFDRIKEFFIIGSLSWGNYRHTQNPRVLALGFIDLFLLFMLEYYGQMTRRIPVPVQGGAALAAYPPARRLYVLDFTIDEQYAVYVVFAIAGQPVLLLEVVFALAGFLFLYKPLQGWRRYYRSIKS